MSLLLEPFRKQAEIRPDAPALIQSRRGVDRALSFAELERRVNRGASRLGRLGIGSGDRVLVLVPVGTRFFEIVLSLLAIGATVVLVRPSAGVRAVKRMLGEARCQAMIADWRIGCVRPFLSALRRIPRCVPVGGPVLFRNRWDRDSGHSDDFETVVSDDEDAAFLSFTSGSTGHPKGIVRTVGVLAAQDESVRRTLRLEPEQRDLTAMPLFVLANLSGGVTSILPEDGLARPGNFRADLVLRQIERLAPNRCGASPTFLRQLVRGAKDSGSGDSVLAGFSRIYTGGGPVTVSLLDELKEAFPQAEIAAVYGSTEAEPIAELRQSELEEFRTGAPARGIPVGRPVGSMEVAVLRDSDGKPLAPMSVTDFRSRCCPDGQVGEIVVSGPAVVRSYLDGKGDRETKIRVGEVIWHRTGDAGYFDDQKRLWLCGRCSARVWLGNRWVYPFELEGLCEDLGALSRTAVVEGDSSVLLLLEWADGVSGSERKEIMRILRDRLEQRGFGSVRLQTIPEIPMDRRHNAKIDYRKLAKFLKK